MAVEIGNRVSQNIHVLQFANCAPFKETQVRLLRGGQVSKKSTEIRATEIARHRAIKRVKLELRMICPTVACCRHLSRNVPTQRRCKPAEFQMLGTIARLRPRYIRGMRCTRV